MNNLQQNCPLCNRKLEQNTRFTNYVCNACSEKATDEKGEPVKFYHARFSSQGIQGYYRRNKELVAFLGNTCFIEGVTCQAFNDGFGGVVIQPVIAQAAGKIAATMPSYNPRSASM